MEIPTGYVSGGDGDRLGGALPHTAEKIGAWERSADRERYEREFAGKPRVEKTPQQLMRTVGGRSQSRAGEERSRASSKD